MRVAKEEYFLGIAELVAERGTCTRRKVGCVLVNDENHIVATGYNGVPRNFTHCIETPCEGAAFPPGEGLDKCLAIHAELNALLQLNEKGPLTMYTTDTPCNECAKVIANSHIERIVAKRKYAQDTLSFLERVGIKVEIKC